MLLTFYRPESLELTNLADVISLTVSNSGEFDTTVLTYARGEGGMGLANVRRRLELCYGEESRFKAKAENGITNVGFFLPLKLA